MYLTKYDPTNGTRSLLGSFLYPNSAFETLFRPWSDSDDASAAYAIPAIDVKEEDRKWTFIFYLPGVKADAIDINVVENELVVEAKRTEEHEDTRDKYTHVERHVGVYKRRITLPESANIETVAAKVDNGVLFVSVEKKESVEPKKIKVELS